MHRSSAACAHGEGGGGGRDIGMGTRAKRHQAGPWCAERRGWRPVSTVAWPGMLPTLPTGFVRPTPTRHLSACQAAYSRSSCGSWKLRNQVSSLPGGVVWLLLRCWMVGQGGARASTAASPCRAARPGRAMRSGTPHQLAPRRCAGLPRCLCACTGGGGVGRQGRLCLCYATCSSRRFAAMRRCAASCYPVLVNPCPIARQTCPYDENHSLEDEDAGAAVSVASCRPVVPRGTCSSGARHDPYGSRTHNDAMPQWQCGVWSAAVAVWADLGESSTHHDKTGFAGTHRCDTSSPLS